MLATLAEEPSLEGSWHFEPKYDGLRLLARKDGDTVALLSRNGKRKDRGFPELVHAVAALEPERLLLDGEVTAGRGRMASFAKLQPRMQLDDPEAARATGVDVTFHLFDLLHVDERALVGEPLGARRAALEALGPFRTPLSLTPRWEGDATTLLDQACDDGWEGLIAKREGATYRFGKRSRDWLKLKCVTEQEFVVVGFTEPEGSRVGLGALLLAYNEDGALRYAGKVGTGFDEATLRRLRATLDDLERARPTLEDEGAPVEAHWTRPVLVAQVAFSEWTRHGRLRHPRFVALRDDKEPDEVVREVPA